MIDMSIKRNQRPVALLLADLHLHHMPLWRMEWANSFIAELLELNKTLQVPLVLLGDVFEIQDRVEARIINQFLNLIVNWNNSVIWITGQHDSYLPGRATLEGLDGVGQLKIVDREVYESEVGFFCVPYARKEEDYRKHLETIPDGATLLTHTPIREALIEFNAKAKGIEQAEFERFRLVLSGDIHKYASFGNFHYIGAPCQRDWRDRGADGKIGVLFKDGTWERYNINSPKHVQITSTLGLRRLALSEEQQYIVKILVPEITPTELEEARLQQNILDVVWQPTAKPEATQLEEEEIQVVTDTELLDEYLRLNKPELSVKKVRAAGIKMLEEICG